METIESQNQYLVLKMYEGISHSKIVHTIKNKGKKL